MKICLLYTLKLLNFHIEKQLSKYALGSSNGRQTCSNGARQQRILNGVTEVSFMQVKVHIHRDGYIRSVLCFFKKQYYLLD
jgi:hypothetical protein